MSKFRSLGPRAGLAVLGSVLGISGTAFALTGTGVVGPHAGAHLSTLRGAHRTAAERHAGVKLAPRDHGDGHGGWGDGQNGWGGDSGIVSGGSDWNPVLTNRDCVYTNRDCVYEDDYHPGNVHTQGDDAFDRVDCVSNSKCELWLQLTVYETLRDGRVIAVTASDGHSAWARPARAARVHRHGSHAGSGHHGRGTSHHGAGAGHHHRHRLSVREVTVGTGHLIVSAKHHATYRLALNASGRLLLRHFGKLHARLSVSVASGHAKVGHSHAGVITFRRH